MTNHALLFVGCGHMGGELLRRWMTRTKGPFHVIKPTPLAEEFRREGVTYSPDLSGLPDGFTPDVVVLAVRPAQASAALPLFAQFRESLFLSLVGGKSLAELATLLGSQGQALVRAMPNLPVAVGAGMTFAYPNQAVTGSQRQTVKTLFQTTGDFVWLENETLFDAGTALSGCGPGYVFALCEALAKAGEDVGFSPEMATRLARQTIAGTGAYMLKSNVSATDLRLEIAGPNKITEAALRPLIAHTALPKLMVDALHAAMAHARSAALHGKRS